jgi:hypothetical protein
MAAVCDVPAATLRCRIVYIDATAPTGVGGHPNNGQRDDEHGVV